MPLILLDTNLLIYLFDQNDRPRQTRAVLVLSRLHEAGAGCISVQSLAEFSAVALRRLQPALHPDEILAHVNRFAKAYPVFPLTPHVVREAVRGVRDYQFAYYDAQIWATARIHQVPTVFSEDFNAAQIETVRFVNPFAADFVLETWL
jgi:predicted nucleic acid-binding protein